MLIFDRIIYDNYDILVIWRFALVYTEIINICFSFFLFTNVIGKNSQTVTNIKLIQSALNQAYSKFQDNKEGKVASYIPELAKVNPNLFAIVVVTKNGKVAKIGDDQKKFAIESISKLFVCGIVLQDYDEKFLLDNIGACATGLPFDSVLAGVVREIKLQNPFVNYGGIQTTSLIKGKSSKEKWERVKQTFSNYAGSEVLLGKRVYESESETNFHNRTLVYLAKTNKKFYSNVYDALDRYTKACSLKVSAFQLAKMGSTLANGGKNPFTHKQVIPKKYIKRLLSLMITTGLYDQSGYWNYTVGVPGKSGVGGGILAIVPNQYAIAVFSPRLNKQGNSVRGIKVMQFLSKKLHLNIYAKKTINNPFGFKVQ